ncbi:MAG: T9SS type A sorting domain-containing protein [Bacteroidota bacterium]
MLKIYLSLFFASFLISFTTPAVSQQLVDDLTNSGRLKFPSEFTEFQGSLYFSAIDDSGVDDIRVLWQYRPGTGATVIFQPGQDEKLGNLFIYQNRLYFSIVIHARGIGYFSQIWSYHPSTGAVLEVDYFRTFFTLPIVYDDTLYFQGSKSVTNSKLWRYHPSVGAKMVNGIGGTYYLDRPTWPDSTSLVIYQGSLYFGAHGYGGYQIYRYSSSTGTVEQATQLRGGDNHPREPEVPHSLTVVNDTLYFSAYDENYNYNVLHRYHPTKGAEVVSDPRSGKVLIYPKYITYYQGSLYLGSLSGGIWSYNPNSGEIKLAADINGPTGDLTVFNDKLYFWGDDRVNGFELWSYDPASGAQLVADINPGAMGSRPNDFTEYQGSLFFSAHDNGRYPGPLMLWAYPHEPLTCCEVLEVEANADGTAFATARTEYYDPNSKRPSKHVTYSLALQSPKYLEWEQPIMVPDGKLSIPAHSADMLVFSRQTASEGRFTNQPLIGISTDLPSASITQLRASVDPLNQQVYLQVSTRNNRRVRLQLSVHDPEDKDRIGPWHTIGYNPTITITAPYAGILKGLPDLKGATLVITQKKRPRLFPINSRQESEVKPTTSLAEEKESSMFNSSIQVYPNPVVDRTLYLQVGSTQAGNTTVQVFDLSGQSVLQRQLPVQPGQQRLIMDIGDIPKGAYILRVQQGQQQSTTRLLVAE